MKRSVKRTLIFGLISLILGLILVGTAFLLMLSLHEFPYKGEPFMKVTHSIDEAFTHIKIEAFDCNISVLPAEGGEVTLICDDTEQLTTAWHIEDGMLTVTRQDARQWYERIFSYGNPSITLYLPEGEWGDLVLRSTSGDLSTVPEHHFARIWMITVSGSVQGLSSCAGTFAALSTSGQCVVSANAAKIECQTTSGDIRISGKTHSIRALTTSGDIWIPSAEVTPDVDTAVDTDPGDGSVYLRSESGMLRATCTAASLTIKGTSGRINLDGVSLTGRLEIDTVSGGILINASDAAEIALRSTSGSVNAQFLSPKNVRTETVSGSVHVNGHRDDGGICEIETVSGGIWIRAERGE